MESTDSGDPLSYSLLQLLQSSLTQLRFEYIAAILAGFILLLLSALTSGAEAAYFSLSEQELEQCKKSQSPTERRVYQLLQDPRKLLTTILVVNNGINVSIITLFAYVAWQVFGTMTLPAGAMLACMLFATFFIVFCGEVLPKVYVQKRRLSIARRTVAILAFLEPVIKPLSSLLLFISSYIEKHYMARGYNHTIEELHHSLDVALKNEETSPEERKILRGVVNFGSITVKQIMRPRVDIAAFNLKATLPELLPQIVEWNYSRVPVYTESTDKIEGILYVKDLLPYLNQGADFRWQELVRPAVFVPETKRISDLFEDIKEKHVHMAIVVNEYGTTAGLLTLEDIVEEILGEINDEFDEDDDIIYSQLDESTFIFDGKTSLHDFCKVAEISFDAFDEVKGENETIAGLMLALFSRIPRVGEEVAFDRFHFTVESADPKRIKRVKINVASKKEHYHKVS
ncbi:gliding motility-associated protein GldE [Pontibacter ummariensis]|uniref:Gliding motility-associated protein GldE n=1 Tax=Pontibacter ummariensis TaxID=1610492 RepID=A0A239JJL0_9BACT|nr:gliding motility-associated protein GldE [Pontibacter ummariensis]PRY07847.1 gliding motility-associated protein GldE [Pontibacter ummariensis]SNT05979.1 gliding motility-associated protein GldE [Pontibacter ummariensis]